MMSFVHGRSEVLVLSLLFLVALAPPAHARPPQPLAQQYIRSDFTVEDGLPDNVVNTIVQTRNGLLWVGTQAGLASFDGREFSPVDLETSGAPAQGAVHALLESSNGDLWAGTDAGVVRIPAAALEEFNPTRGTFYPLGEGPSDEVGALLQTRAGEIWAGTNHGLYRLDAGKFVVAIPAVSVSSISEALDHHLLIVTGRKFIEWDGSKVIDHPGLAARLGVHDGQIFSVFEDRSGTMWYCTALGIRELGPRATPPLQPAKVATTTTFRAYADPQGRLWMATGIGIYRVEGDRLESPAPGVNARSFYAGADGELWLGTNGSGLVHLKPRVVHMFTSADGLPDNNIAMAVLATHEGKLWVGSNCGLSVLEGGRFRNYRENDGLLNSCVWSLAEDPNGNIWIGTYGGGLFRFRDGHFAQYLPAQGLVSKVVLQVTVAHDGSLWMATPDGISHMRNGRFRNYTAADGLSSNKILAVFEDRSGTIWAATQGGIDRLAGERFTPLSSAQSRDGSFPIGFGQDSLGDLYAFNSPKGISVIENNRLIRVNDDLKVLGMVESPQHDLWFSGTDGILRVRLEDLRRSITDRETPLDYERIDRTDGLSSVQCSSGPSSVAITPDGKLWVATVKGVAMLDLAHLPAASRKPKVFVGSITIGQNRQLAEGAALLPPGTHHVQLDLEAVDLGSPEKVRLQYRLDGVDAAWLDADDSRTAVYTNVPVGTHAFHVRGSGSDGAWDRAGIVYDITQQPYFYQTTWFQVFAITALFLLVATAYVLRVQQIVRQAHMRAEERLMERERIARELHDTLLQGVLSASMHLEAAHDQLPEESPARPVMRKVLVVMRQVIEEGRNALRGLRTKVADDADLAVAFSRIGQEFGIDDRIALRVTRQSDLRTLRSRIRGEVYRIGREAVMNAFLHAKPKSVDVILEEAGRSFRLIVRDDGCGIDPHVLDAGREGHWGLAGMRERSESIGGTLRLRSRLGAGTEVELIVPQAIAFVPHSGAAASRWLRWLRRAPRETHELDERRRVNE
ncbi:MAG TPA: two-component regulator propeller domain-containing protein [Acidobacteriaceae bacterium]|jgi:signal transduction histidine kinase/ligand-binding sensor domain-containing protein|nr:two-component regulator propeller domain-containing protein [Acidobacteriaceae bacterium]